MFDVRTKCVVLRCATSCCVVLCFHAMLRYFVLGIYATLLTLFISCQCIKIYQRPLQLAALRGRPSHPHLSIM